jgi:hypothetical protein
MDDCRRLRGDAAPDQVIAAAAGERRVERVAVAREGDAPEVEIPLLEDRPIARHGERLQLVDGDRIRLEIEHAGLRRKPELCV